MKRRIQKKENSEDISSKTILIMLVLVIVVSIACLALYLTALSDVTDAQTPLSQVRGMVASQAQGVASIEILPPPNNNQKNNGVKE